MGATLLLLSLIFIAQWSNASEARDAGPARIACTGSTSELLQCHSGEIKEFLRRWVIAWGDGDIETYLMLYTQMRSPIDSLTRNQWIENRRERISPDKDIEINLKLESMGLENSGIFDVVFVQHYRSSDYRDQVRKRLFLLREAGELRIWKEENLE